MEIPNSLQERTNTIDKPIKAANRRRAYPTDLSNEEWRRIRALVPYGSPLGRKRSVDLREIVNAIFYRRRIRCPWRMLPHDYPPWETVYYYYRQWRADGTLDAICAVLRR